MSLQLHWQLFVLKGAIYVNVDQGLHYPISFDERHIWLRWSRHQLRVISRRYHHMVKCVASCENGLRINTSNVTPNQLAYTSILINSLFYIIRSSRLISKKCKSQITVWMRCLHLSYIVIIYCKRLFAEMRYKSLFKPTWYMSDNLVTPPEDLLW